MDDKEMDDEFDPQGCHFDAYKCWEDADCYFVEEMQCGDVNDDDYEEYLYCSAPEGFVCPLYKAKVEKDLKCDIM